MNAMIFDDDFSANSVTPSFESLTKKGNYKLLVAIFIIDCSETMSGERIAGVNAALRELKYELTQLKNEHNLDLKVAIMSFASSAKWELELTPIDEINLKDIRIRAGSTEYGAAFHLLNKVLNKDGFMQHTGKIAPPAIMFLTDGEPGDDYQPYLNELLQNPYFENANRSVILLGDAINNDAAKKAVSQFVLDSNNDIAAVENSNRIIKQLKLGTLGNIHKDVYKKQVSDDAQDLNTEDSDLTDMSISKDDDIPVKADDVFGTPAFDAAPFDFSIPSDDAVFGFASVSDDNPFGDVVSNDHPFGDAISTDSPLGNIADIDNSFSDIVADDSLSTDSNQVDMANISSDDRLIFPSDLGADSLTNTDSPFEDVANNDNPFGDIPNTDSLFADIASTDNPFGDVPNTDSPFGDVANNDNPFGDIPNTDSLFADIASTDNPFGDVPNTDNSFGEAVNEDNPFESANWEDNPFGDGSDIFNSLI